MQEGQESSCGQLISCMQIAGLTKQCYTSVPQLCTSLCNSVSHYASFTQVGDPPVALLDEPSTGMDPGSRRGMWDLLQGEVQGAGGWWWALLVSNCTSGVGAGWQLLQGEVQGTGGWGGADEGMR
jgi:hypothetical protein